MTDHESQFDTQLDAYVDGVMAPQERADFERRLETDESLRREVERQQDIDDSLRRMFAPPGVQRAAVMLNDDAAPSTAATRSTSTRRSIPWLRKLAVAASIGAGIVGSWLIWDVLGPQGRGGYGPWRDFETVYAQAVTNGMEPDWICETEQEFADSFRNRYGQAAVIPFDLPDGMEAIGLAYCNSISRRTICLYAQVNDQPVIVFADRVETDGGQSVDSESGLNLFHRRLGRLTLYEITPLPAPVLLDLFYDPDVE